VTKFSVQERADRVRFFIPEDHLPALRYLPWGTSLDGWNRRNVRLLDVKSGLSRHIVRFVESGGRRYAVKETSEPSARRELACYHRLRRMGIPTLSPVGVVVRYDGRVTVETRIGRQHQDRCTGFLVTELMEKVLPDSFLFRRAFTRENRNRIWDTVIRLFVELHANGVYWGDASLANMLISFSTGVVPEVGRRTRLQAVLADAETVEIRPSVSDTLRLSDVEFFLESMQWNEADLKASGIVRDPLITRDDRHYLLGHYTELYAVELEMRSFELITHIDVDRLLGNFDAKGYGRLLLKHINEHKWYLSERTGRDVPLAEAAEDWYAHIFRPVCGVFNDYGLPGHFPDKTASSLYVEIMEHKYFMSQKEKRDVGLVAALGDYATRFAPQETVQRTFGDIIRAVTSLFRGDQREGNIYLS